MSNPLFESTKTEDLQPESVNSIHTANDSGLSTLRNKIEFLGSRRTLVVILILAFGILAGSALRVLSVEHKQTPSHNEAISFIASTCHQAEWSRIEKNELFPSASWAHAGDWQKLWQIDQKFCFSEISSGLLNGDIHPPLYFWTLHLWFLVFGVGMTSAVFLNILITALTGLALFGLGRRVTGNSILAAFAVLIWTVSPAVISISSEARQYDLFALVTVAFIWQIFRLSDPKLRMGVGNWLLLALLATAGVLTQYIFGVVAAVGFLVLAVGLLRRKRLPLSEIAKRFGMAISAICLGYLTLPFLHPGFETSLQTGKIRGGRFSVEEFSERANRVLATLTDFVIGKGINNGLARFIVPVVVIGITVVCCLIWMKRRRKVSTATADRAITPAGGRAVLLAFSLTAVTIFLYVSFYTPNNAMGASYLAWAWPFIALTIAMATNLLKPRLRVPALALIATVFLISGVASSSRVDSAAANQPNATKLVQTSDTLFVDTTRRGILPAILWHTKPTQRIFAAPQQEILNLPQKWEDRLGKRFLYIGGTLMGSTELDRLEVIKELRKKNVPMKTLGALYIWYPKLLTGTPETVMLWKRSSS